MGARGPVPKRSDQRHSHQERSDGVTVIPGASKVTVPRADGSWHPVAKRWYESLDKSGQSALYEPSDWAVAFLIAESMSRDLNPQVVGVLQEGKEAGTVVKETIPLKGASLAAYLKAMSSLMVTEGDRRRLQLELQRPGGGESEPLGTVTDISDRRSRLTSA